MIFDGIVLLFILIMTSYLATQGTLSALWTLISASFASLVAMGTFETLAFTIAKWKPDYSRGLAFLAIFLVAFLICKLLGDNLVTKNIRLPKGVDRGVGALFGFLTGLIAVGTSVLGVQMLPLPTALLGYDRFGTPERMQGDTPGVAAEPKNLWLAPEAFTMKFWDLASGRGLGGAREFASVHPNLATESYGYRNVVQYGQGETLAGGLTATAAYLIPPTDTALMKRYGIQEGKQGYIVRCEIEGGADGDAMFRLSDSEIRLVTDKNKDYYPIGYLEGGTTFTPLKLTNGNVVDDEPSGKDINDWVFQIGPGEKPTVVEVKGLARADLNDLPSDKPLTALAVGVYPHHDYKKTEGTVTVTVEGTGNVPMSDVQVLLCRTTITRGDFGPIIKPSYQKTLDVISAYNADNTEWKDPPPAHTYYPLGAFTNAQRQMREAYGAAPDYSISLRDQLPHMYTANSPNSISNGAGILENFTKTVVIPTLLNSTGSTVITQGTTDASGKVTLQHCPKGGWVVFAGVKSGNDFYMWCANVDVQPKQDTPKSLAPGGADFKFPAP
ncbi:MAG TPA: CvpA family protein [Phycisphaerae bacterium]|nr:CvpA family protein [Phycisphaerae bacterium]